MGLFKNFFVGGSRPQIQNGLVRCGECREIIQPDAKRCPYCSSDIFTLKGRILSRFPALFGGMIMLGGSSAPGMILPGLLYALGLTFICVAIYYFINAPIYYIRPPHRPQRPNG